MSKVNKFFSLIVFVFWVSQTLLASKLVEMKVVDKDYLMLHFKDAEVKFVDDGLGPGAYGGHESLDPDNSYVISYGDTLDLTNAAVVENWTIKSENDGNYGTSGVSPNAVYRKSRINGMSYTGWDTVNNDFSFDYTKEHFIYLELPSSMEQDKIYTVAINANIHADTISQPLTFDIFNCPSEAIHTNLVGYMSSSRLKAADLYHFMGDGGNRDYSDFVGNEVYIYNVSTEESQSVGSATFWMESETETYYNLTGSNVWNIDFTGFNREGTYRLAVEGVGCSEDFEIRDDIYHDPFKVSVLGYFYMRIGQDNMDMTPVPRRPLYIQGEDPSGCEIFVTDMHPYHPEWNTFAGGGQGQWDNPLWNTPSDWEEYIKPGSPTNPGAIGGHSDAHDWDRFLDHVVNIYDICLAYILSDGALDDDDFRIAESGNGIPDILDEVRNEVDFWLSLRYNGGYSHGLTNPDDNNKLYQADNTAMAAWANALNSSMLAYCFQIAGLNDLKNTYQDSAIIAYNYVDNLADPMLDTQIVSIRGIDFKMMTAAYLYNLTGDTEYEDIIDSESVVDGPHSKIYQSGSYNQLWGTAAYLLTERPVHYPDLYADMKSSIISRAKWEETDYVNQRPSRRGYNNDQAWHQTSQDMHRTVIAHAITDNAADQLDFLDALSLEADWGLGRNPLNMIQMTTATTELADKRSIENCYTSGRDDGTPGLHPGHTPLLGTEGWGEGQRIGNNPQKILEKYYPDIGNWPHASKYINTRYIWAHSEFCPRYTMRGKTLLYAYLYGLSSKVSSITPDLVTGIPDEFKLFNNYPNPFNLKTKITYNLPENSKVKMEVYNIAGRRVKTLINDDKKDGSYEIIFDGSELPSGIYLCTLEAGKYRDTKKMILLK
jgi:endoglucanase